MVSFILPGNSATGGYEVDNSLRFNSGDSPYLSKSIATVSDTKKFTFSTWFKRSKIPNSNINLFGADGGSTRLSQLFLYEGNDQHIRLYDSLSSTVNIDLTTDMVFRDISAWYNVVVQVDSTQSTQTDRVKMYINGSQVTFNASATAHTYPGENASFNFQNASSTSMYVGSSQTSAGAQYGYYDGYMAETVYLDGQSVDQNSFGEFDDDSPTIWKPKNVSSLTFGNNGFYLEYKQTGTSANSSGIGADTSGNDNHLTVHNLAATDQSTDTCTNNYATLNPLDAYYYNGTFSEGNLQTTTATSEYGYLPANIGVSLGKWYCEIEWDAKSGGGGAGGIGITSTQSTASNIQLGQNANDYKWYGPDGNVYNNNSGIVSLSTFSTGDIVGIYLDLDNNKLYFAKNGTIQNSGTGISITDPASTTLGFYFFAIDYASSSYAGTFKANFGNPITTISSGNSDPNGYGNFEYSPNDGGSASFDSSAKNFYALNSKNLAEYG
jgi:hypothetical protein